eukprot:3034102-Amphidinium_carterae.1
MVAYDKPYVVFSVSSFAYRNVFVPSGEEVAVQKLLAAGADANACDPVSTPRSRGATALIRAARSGHAAVVNVLLQACHFWGDH